MILSNHNPFSEYLYFYLFFLKNKAIPRRFTVAYTFHGFKNPAPFHKSGASPPFRRRRAWHQKLNIKKLLRNSQEVDISYVTCHPIEMVKFPAVVSIARVALILRYHSGCIHSNTYCPMYFSSHLIRTLVLSLFTKTIQQII